jgi:serine protease inhibitor
MQVDEKGAEAAAATVVMMERSFGGPRVRLTGFLAEIVPKLFRWLCFDDHNSRMRPTNAPSRPRPDTLFTADHPFLIALVRDGRHVLFLGRYAVPA